MFRPIWIGIVLAACAAGMAGAARAADDKKEPGPKGLEIKTALGQPLPAEERNRVAAAIRAHLKVAEGDKDKIRLLHARRAAGGDKDAPKDLVEAVLFNYATGKALRLALEVPTGKVVREEELPGLPQPSPEEIKEAKGLVEKDPEHAKLVKAGGVLEGGFVTEPPKEVAPKGKVPHRILQLLSADRTKFERIIYVDLTDRKILSSKAEH
jgi:hypothetical protein